VAGPGIFGHPIQGCSKWIIALWPGLCTAIPRMVAGPTDKSISFLQHGIWILRAIMDYVTFLQSCMLFPLSSKIIQEKDSEKLICSSLFQEHEL
jgi:hypothetical protein